MAGDLTVLFAFGALICWGVGDFFIQRCARKIGDLESLAYIGLIGVLGLLPFVAPEFHLLFSWRAAGSLVVLGIVTFIAAILDFEALKKGKLAIVDLTFEFELPVTIALGVLFFGDSLSVFQIFFIGMVFAGMILIAAKEFRHWKTKLEKGVLLAFAAAFFMGLVNYLTASSSRSISPLIAIWGAWLVLTVMAFVMIGSREGFRTFVKNGVRFRWIVLLMGIIDTAAWILYSHALFSNPLSITTSITESYPAIALLLGVYVNKEKISWHQYAGAGIALAASFLLSFTV